MIQRFCQELDRALPHRLNPHPGVSVSSNEDDREIAFLVFQPGLQVQTRHRRHKDVSYQACDLTVQTPFEEVFRASEAPCRKPRRLHKVAQRLLHVLIIVYDRNHLDVWPLARRELHVV
jgi:hypothetical protein